MHLELISVQKFQAYFDNVLPTGMTIGDPRILVKSSGLVV